MPPHLFKWRQLCLRSRSGHLTVRIAGIARLSVCRCTKHRTTHLVAAACPGPAVFLAAAACLGAVRGSGLTACGSGFNLCAVLERRCRPARPDGGPDKQGNAASCRESGGCKLRYAKEQVCKRQTRAARPVYKRTMLRNSPNLGKETLTLVELAAMQGSTINWLGAAIVCALHGIAVQLPFGCQADER